MGKGGRSPLGIRRGSPEPSKKRKSWWSQTRWLQGYFGAPVVQALKACGRVGPCSMATRGGIPSEEQAIGLEREMILAARNDLEPYNMLAPKTAPETKRSPTSIPSIPDKQIASCICEEDSSAVIWFYLHKGKTRCCPNCGTHYKLAPHKFSH
ncbi:cytochrome c oxidase subunit 5B, mitochondrial-like [Trichosurus vulpecula]|uniref:cytochrome c oxidase subunit 5B, mitochondrial-like n=1 Tax=Trichosurus vulpecula TaxID=9337 RepID=UPI00186B4B00|nr:cytochrome c oxidase subunit 5B, mitochondrial-like [Trichosurus vulpecula]